MAANLVRGVISLQAVLCLVLLLGGSVTSGSSDVQDITTENFPNVLEGEWMIEFFAPWCPACKQFSGTWENFGTWAATETEYLKVGKVDVTAETMLSGQFMVTHLPTIFHIIDGEVRPYYESRALEELKNYVEEESWKEQDPIPWWRSPTAPHMKSVGLIFWLSEKAKEFQVVLEERYELPTYAVFIVIALATIVVGLALGGLTVCCIEVCMRLCSRKQPAPKSETKEKEGDVHKEIKTKDEVKPKEEEKRKEKGSGGGGGTEGSSARKRKKDKKQGSSSEDKGQST